MGKLKFALQVGFLACVAIILVSVIAARYPNYIKLSREEAQLREDLDRKQKEEAAVRAEIDSAGTDAFIMKMARERLGMIREDEFRFIIDY